MILSAVACDETVSKGIPVLLDLGEVRDFNAVKLTFKFREKIPYSLEVSTDGETFNPVKLFEYDDKKWQKTDASKGRYLRFNFHEDQDVVINEIRVSKP